MLRLALVLTALAFATPALAVDLVNKDSESYKVNLIDGASTTRSSIGSNTTQMSVCSSCTIEVEGVGSVDAPEGSTVVIQNGQIAVE
jgi:hypothetical protein